MYESHFGFHRQPFQCAELTRAFFVSQSIQTIVPQLLHALRSDLGIAVLTGPVGVGKTSLLKHMQTLLATEGRAIVCSGASLELPLNVLQTLHTSLHGRAAQRASLELAARDVSQSRWTLLDQLQKSSELWGPVLLLIDDAQLLPVSVLNELRAFTEEEWNGRSLVRCLIAGPLSLEEELARPTHADFSHRIRCHAFLQPLTSRESLELLSRHLEAVGGQLHRVFSTQALELIAAACDGLPRCLSLLADESLVVAAERKRAVADDECVRIALGRLQHLPYSWSASPMTSEESSHVDTDDDGSHASPIRKSSGEPSATSSPVLSSDSGVGFVEFGAPSSVVSRVIEIGGPSPVASNERPVDVGQISLPSKQSTQSSVEFGSFEVGRRFLQDSADVVDVEPEVTEFAELSSIQASDDADIPGLNAGYGLSWEHLEESFSITEFNRPTQMTSLSSDEGVILTNSVTPATSSPSIVYSGSATKVVSETSPPSENSERSDDRWLSAMTGSGYTQRLPVFDRYTWVALGREVPAGTYAVRSSSLVNRTAYDDAVAQSGRNSSRQGQSFDSIGIIETTSEEIDRRLSPVPGMVEVGEFAVSHTSDHVTHHGTADAVSSIIEEISRVPAIGVEFFNPPDAQSEWPAPAVMLPIEPVRSDENRRAIRDAILSRLSQVDSLRHRSDIEDLVDSAISTFDAAGQSELSNESHWLDGQLVFGKNDTSEVSTPESPFGNSEATDQISISIESARTARQDAAANAGNVSESDRPTFFTLPSDVNAISWDLRSEVIDEFLPLAESLSALQNEVSSFHQNLGKDDSHRWDNDRDNGFDASSMDDSLLAQARRRLDGASLNHESAIEGVPVGALNSLVQKSDIVASIAEDSNGGAQAEVKQPPAFGQLFTRLRQLRKASGEN